MREREGREEKSFPFLLCREKEKFGENQDGRDRGREESDPRNGKEWMADPPLDKGGNLPEKEVRPTAVLYATEEKGRERE